MTNMLRRTARRMFSPAPDLPPETPASSLARKVRVAEARGTLRDRADELTSSEIADLAAGLAEEGE